MATFARNADVEWTGNLMEGSGTAKAGTGAFSLPVTFPSRIAAEGDGKTTPEELMAASHAVCYAMVLTNTRAQTVAVTITQLATSQYSNTNYGGILAEGVIITIPIVLLFVFLQRFLIEGMTAGAIKG